jgi:hypothetical protein
MWTCVYNRALNVVAIVERAISNQYIIQFYANVVLTEIWPHLSNKFKGERNKPDEAISTRFGRSSANHPGTRVRITEHNDTLPSDLGRINE